MDKLLDSINDPQDLKKIEVEKLPLLAREIRKKIIDTVSVTGGHLASSLGAVELIIGVHYCFDAPRDAIIFDVGHQAYAHKLLTGRKASFFTLRQHGGLSGFPNRFESEYDVFTTGHGSTSISTALGLASARDLTGKPGHKIIAIIGDASLGGGMAFEALNHAGHLKKQLLVILNDNEMSISRSVGALSKYLNRIITAPVYNRIRKDIEALLKRIPMFGFRAIRAARRLEEGLKNLLVPGMLFEELGFRYFGPIDGNDVVIVVKMLNNIRDMEGPVLLHVVTKKGKGYHFAERVPEKFHGVSSFDVTTGERLLKHDYSGKRPYTTFTEAFTQAIVRAGEKRRDIIAITAAMPEGTGLHRFGERFPERFFDVGMAEQHAVGFAAGLARGGLKPVVAIYSTFLQRAYDQIIHDVCLQKLNVLFMVDRAGLVGEDGPTHHGAFDISYLRHMPGMVIMAPRDEEELIDMFKFSLGYNKGPVAIRYPRGSSYPVDYTFEDRDIKLGRAVLLREGRDLTILSVGYMTNVCLEVSRLFERDGIDCEVINARFIRPLDRDPIIKSFLKTRRLFTVEEGVVEGGFGSSVLETLIDKIPDSGIIRNIGLPADFIEHGKRLELLDKYGLTPAKIKEAIEGSMIWQR